MSINEYNHIIDCAKQLKDTGSLPYNPVNYVVGHPLSDLLLAHQIYKNVLDEDSLLSDAADNNDDLEALYPDPVFKYSKPIELQFT